MNIIKIEDIEKLIVVIRNKKVILDSDVAKIYGVITKKINKAVKNNIKKFPSDYMFEITDSEFNNLRLKFSTAKFSKTRTNPKVFTEKGLYMLATILKSKKAIEV